MIEIVMDCVGDFWGFFFFFFKQKTADEVRISDWSSDVCSSDLIAGGRGRRIACITPPRAPKPPGVHNRRGRRPVRPNTVVRPPGGRRRSRFAPRLPDVTTRSKPAVARRRYSVVHGPIIRGNSDPGARLGNRLRPAPCSTARHRKARARHRPTGRSAEHTSELQSLMRISYAVLCLKTKLERI